MEESRFRKALPVWQEGKSEEMNYNLVFRTFVPKGKNAKIYVTASSMYQMFIGSRLVAEGPARAGHGYYRVDEIDVSGFLTQDNNIVCIYVDGYYVENYYLIKQPSFLCAEVEVDGEIISATGKGGFEAKYNDARIRNIVRYSFQRTFCEAYRFDENRLV